MVARSTDGQVWGGEVTGWLREVSLWRRLIALDIAVLEKYPAGVCLTETE
jgi:hypothetical protein